MGQNIPPLHGTHPQVSAPWEIVSVIISFLCFYASTIYCYYILLHIVYLSTTDRALKHFLPIFYFISIFSRRFYAELNAHQVTCSVVDLAYNLTTWGILFHAFRASGRTSGIPVGLSPHMSLKNFYIFIIKYIFSFKKITKKDTPGFDLCIIGSEAWISTPTNQVTYTFMPK